MLNHLVLPSTGHSPGRAARRCRPASRGCRSRSRQWGCRPPHWYRHSSHCSSGPTSRWDMVGCSRGPATLRGGNEPVTSPVSPLPPVLSRASRSHHHFSDRWVRSHSPHTVHSEMRTALRRTGATARLLPPGAHWFCFGLMTPGGAGVGRALSPQGGVSPLI